VDYTSLLIKRGEADLKKRTRQRQEKDIEEMKECKFKPNISEASSSLVQ
jgi:hypothetical protein